MFNLFVRAPRYLCLYSQTNYWNLELRPSHCFDWLSIFNCNFELNCWCLSIISQFSLVGEFSLKQVSEYDYKWIRTILPSEYCNSSVGSRLRSTSTTSKSTPSCSYISNVVVLQEDAVGVRGDACRMPSSFAADVAGAPPTIGWGGE